MSVERLAYKIAEAAEALGVSTDHVRRLIRDGQLRSVRLGGAILIPVIEIERVLGIEQSRVELTPEQILDALSRLVNLRQPP